MEQTIGSHYEIGDVVAQSDRFLIHRGQQILEGDLRRDVVIAMLRPASPEAGDADVETFAEASAQLLELSQAGILGEILDAGAFDGHGQGFVFPDDATPLRARIGDAPANPADVMQLAAQSLQILEYLHAKRKTPYLCFNLSPDVLGLYPGGVWGLLGFGIHADGQADDRLRDVDVKYAAPELMDAEMGEPSPATDLYSLGMCLYEYALGRKAFSEQVLAVYGETGDEPERDTQEYQEKWLYWHVSEQLQLKPIKEIVPEFPPALSHVIEKMLVKRPEGRESFAANLLQKLDWQGVNRTFAPPRTRETSKGALTPLAKVLIAILATFVLVGGAAAYMHHATMAPKIVLTESQLETDESYVHIRGVVRHMPRGGSLVVTAQRRLLTHRKTAVVDSESGRFDVQVALPELGEYVGYCGLLDAQESVLTKAICVIKRTPPKQVMVTFVTKPAALDATVVVTYPNPKNLKQQVERTSMTDEDGQMVMSIPYGAYSIRVSHPLYVPYYANFSTGFEDVATQAIPLQRTNKEVTKKLLLRLFKEYAYVNSSSVPGDPAALHRLGDIQEDIIRLTPLMKSSLTQEELFCLTQRETLLDRLDALEGAEPSPAVKREVDGIQKKLTELQTRLLSPSQLEKVKQQTVLEAEIARLSDQPGEAAQKEMARMKSVVNDITEFLRNPANMTLAQLIEKRKHLVRTIHALSARTSLTSRQQKEYLETLGHLNAMNRVIAGIPVAEAASAVEPGTSSGVEVVAPEMTPVVETGVDDAESGVTVEAITPETLFEMDLSMLASIVRGALPAKSFVVSVNVLDNKVDVQGVVLDRESLYWLANRLAPVYDRLNTDVEIDPVSIVDALEKDIAALPVADARVHPFLLSPTHRLFVGVPRDTTNATMESIRSLCAAYIANPSRYMVERFPDGHTAQRAPAAAKPEGAPVPVTAVSEDGHE